MSDEVCRTTPQMATFQSPARKCSHTSVVIRYPLLMKKTQITIRTCTVEDIETAPGIGDIIGGYAEESAISLLPQPQPLWDVYRNMELSGRFRVIAAFDGERIVGLATVIAPVLMPHYGFNMATMESIFVLRDYRKTGAGIRLLRAAEKASRDAGAKALLMTAPVGGSLDNVLPRIGYANTHNMFCRRLA